MHKYARQNMHSQNTHTHATAAASEESEPGDLSRVHPGLLPSGYWERPQHPVIGGR